jgi:hypothetical protein
VSLQRDVGLQETPHNRRDCANDGYDDQHLAIQRRARVSAFGYTPHVHPLHGCRDKDTADTPPFVSQSSSKGSLALPLSVQRKNFQRSFQPLITSIIVNTTPTRHATLSPSTNTQSPTKPESVIPPNGSAWVEGVTRQVNASHTRGRTS